MDNSYDNFGNLAILIPLLVILALLLFLALYLDVIKPFLKEREYIKMEMNRSSGKERAYWKKELRALYKSKLPIIGRFLR